MAVRLFLIISPFFHPVFHIRLNGKTVGTVVLAIFGALLLGIGMSLCMVFGKMILGVVIGLVGIVALLMLIPLTKGLK